MPSQEHRHLHPASSPANPVPLRDAALDLLSWAAALPSHPPASAVNPDTPRARRHRIAVHPPSGGLIPWLRAQKSPQALLFRCRDRSFEVAGVGFAHRATGAVFDSAAHGKLAALLDPAAPDMRFYGATRFDANAAPAAHADPLWLPYDGYTFVLPAVELLREGPRCFLAATAAPGRDGPGSTIAALRALVAPRYLRAPPPAPPVARPVSVRNLTSFRAWDASMAAILARLRAGTYDKIVLARRKRFTFAPAAPPDVLAVVTAIEAPPKAVTGARPAAPSAPQLEPSQPQPQPQPQMSQAAAAEPCLTQASGGGVVSSSGTSSDGLVLETITSRNSYLFCLQLDAGHAFVGCTPERLFRVDGPRLLTEALAGTVRRGDTTEDEARIAELCCTKNMEEHRFVVDYVQDRLVDAGLAVRACGPRVVRLPRLMHLATDITGCFASEHSSGDAGATPSDNISGLTHRLLESMHPTPAVGGIPVEKTMADLPALENFDRGFFAGPLGWFSSTSSDFCVAIRSALISGNVVTAYAGSGIVNGSESRSEWDETELKMSAFTDMFGAPSTQAPSASQDWTASDCSAGDDTVVQENVSCQTSMNGSGKRVNGHAKQTEPPDALDALDESNGSAMPSEVGKVDSSPPDTLFDPRRLRAEPNINSLWGNLVVEELCRCGVDQFFVCPGSRSAPLAAAVARSRRARLTVIHDERGAAFMAVGFARATARAAAVVTSSGTAVANLLPAIVEAANDHLPLVALTADRPPELRDVGANQAIDQVKIFGSYVRWFKDVPCPTSEIPVRNVLSDIDHAVFKSGSTDTSYAQVEVSDCGPVHLNFMFREMLAPDPQSWSPSCISSLPEAWTHGTARLTSYARQLLAPPPTSGVGTAEMHAVSHGEDEIYSLLSSRQNVMVVVGGGAGGAHDLDDRLAIVRLAERNRWPVIADIASGLRLEKQCSTLVPFGDLAFASPVLRDSCHIEAVVQFGERLTSKRVLAALSGPGCPDVYVVVSPSGARSDPSLTVSHRFIGSPCSFVNGMLQCRILGSKAIAEGVDTGGVQNRSTAKSMPEKRRVSETKSLLDYLEAASQAVDTFLSTYVMDPGIGSMVEPFIARGVSEAILPGTALFVGNSMPIRDFDSFASCGKPSTDWSDHIVVSANRGASGIDGVISSGIGYALGSCRPTVIVIGDMSFLHDLSALHALRPTTEGGVQGPPVTIVVVNNGGGGIFAMLPIARHKDIFSPVFDTPHNVSFSGVADAFGMRYSRVNSTKSLREQLDEMVDGQHRIIEAFVCAAHDAEADFRRKLIADIGAHVSNALTSADGGPRA